MTREYADGKRRVMINRTFQNKRDALAEVIKAFAEVGAYI